MAGELEMEEASDHHRRRLSAEIFWRTSREIELRLLSLPASNFKRKVECSIEALIELFVGSFNRTNQKKIQLRFENESEKKMFLLKPVSGSTIKFGSVQVFQVVSFFSFLNNWDFVYLFILSKIVKFQLI